MPSTTDDEIFQVWMSGQMRGAVADDKLVISGMDCNLVLDTRLDCNGTRSASQICFNGAASALSGSAFQTVLDAGLPVRFNIAEAVLDAGCQCAFRLCFPDWQVGFRWRPSGATFLIRVMLRQTPQVRCIAAAIHWHHNLPSDHAPMVVHVLGIAVYQVPTVDAPRHGMGVLRPVPWCRFVSLADGARSANDPSEKRLAAGCSELTSAQKSSVS